MRSAISGPTLALVAVVAACQAEEPPAPPSPSTTSTQTAAAPTDTVAPPAPTSATPAPTAPDPNDYKSCAVDSDCEAVDRAGCCNNGFKEAITRGKEDVYRQVNACTKRVMCPQYILRDTRTPACNPTTHRCEMVGKAP
jgi:hypothetical protein